MKTSSFRDSFPISRTDAFSRCIGILDQMGDMWPYADQVRKTVGRIAVQVRDTQIPLSVLAEQANQMGRTFPENSKGWAIFGCLQNILLGGNRQSRN